MRDGKEKDQEHLSRAEALIKSPSSFGSNEDICDAIVQASDPSLQPEDNAINRAADRSASKKNLSKSKITRESAFSNGHVDWQTGLQSDSRHQAMSTFGMGRNNKGKINMKTDIYFFNKTQAKIADLMRDQAERTVRQPLTKLVSPLKNSKK